jgi:hypothetical protein
MPLDLFGHAGIMFESAPRSVRRSRCHGDAGLATTDIGTPLVSAAILPRLQIGFRMRMVAQRHWNQPPCISGTRSRAPAIMASI